MVLAAAGTAQRTARNAVRAVRCVVAVVMSVTFHRGRPATPSGKAPPCSPRPTPNQTVQFNTDLVKRKRGFPKPRRLRPMTSQRYGTVLSGSVITTNKAPASDGRGPEERTAPRPSLTLPAPGPPKGELDLDHPRSPFAYRRLGYTRALMGLSLPPAVHATRA